MRPRISVRGSVRPSVCPSIRNPYLTLLIIQPNDYFYICLPLNFFQFRIFSVDFNGTMSNNDSIAISHVENLTRLGKWESVILPPLSHPALPPAHRALPLAHAALPLALPAFSPFPNTSPVIYDLGFRGHALTTLLRDDSTTF